MIVVTNRARAYMNWGRWISACPEEACNSAETLTRGQGMFQCSECHVVAPIEWPPNADEITLVLMERPEEHTRNWYPAGHELAVRFRSPHGQTVEELKEEAREFGVEVYKDNCGPWCEEVEHLPDRKVCRLHGEVQ